MTPEKVYERFGQEFPYMKDQVTKFVSRRTKDGVGSIRLLLRNHKILTFTINKDGTYSLTRGVI